MRRRLRPRIARRRWPIAFGALALALLLAQTLGLLHGIAHGGHGGAHRVTHDVHELAHGSHGDVAPRIAVHAHDDAAAPHAAHDSYAVIAALFDAHEDESSECRLYDQLTHGDALWSAIAPLTSTPPQPAHAHHAAPAPRAAAASWFLARAPPLRG
jgi:hypothetical protein